MNITAMQKARKEAFLSLYGVATQKELVKLFREDCEKHKAIKNDDEAKELSGTKLFSKYALAITFLYSLSTIKTNLKAYKAVIRELRLEKVQSKFFFEGLSPSVNEVTKKNMEKRIEVNKSLPFDVLEEINLVSRLLRGDLIKPKTRNQTKEMVRSYYIAYVLGLSTGRRFTEILKTVKIVKRKGKYFFNGILKKDKNRDKNNGVEAHFIGLSPTLINSYLKELREYLNNKLLKEKNITLDNLTENQINTVFHRVYNNAVWRISENKVKNFHELRHYYTVAHQDRYLEFNPQLRGLNKTDLEVVLKNVRYTVLGHEITPDSTETYVTIK